jgi:uncharacterized protein (TIGR03032 family)
MATPPADDNPTQGPTALRAVHTPNFPELLRRLGASLLVTTYQAGKLALVRNEGDHLNVHHRAFKAPMGLALADGGAKLAVGTTLQIWQFRDVPDVARRLPPAGTHDGCYLPRCSHVTGNVLIHEMAYGAGGALWFVNTRFSCLATLDPEASFVPRWRPPFITELEPSDRCHLNGLALVDGKPKYVTALGAANTMGGWRPNKARGGVLLDVGSGETLCRGLSMPHSPRWYGGRLWVCESGSGTLGTVDPATGRYEAVAAAPGFTRAGLRGGVGHRRAVAGARVGGVQRHPHHRAAGPRGADLRRLRHRPAVRRAGSAAALRERRAGGVRRGGAAAALPGFD